MDTPLRRSRRLEGLKPEPFRVSAEAARARRALAPLEWNPEETRQPACPGSAPPLGLGSPRREPDTSSGSPSLPQSVVVGSPGHQPETSPGAPSPRQGAHVGSLRRQPEIIPGSPSPRQRATAGSPGRQPEPDPASPLRQQDPGLGSAPRQPESSPAAPQLEESAKSPQGQEEVDSGAAQSTVEPTPGSPQGQLQPGPASPEPYPGQQAPGPEPSQPAPELTAQAPGCPQGQQEPSQPRQDRETATGDPGARKRGRGCSDQAPAGKKAKQQEERLPVVPKGKPKSGRVWKDRSKKRFSQMVQDKPLRTSWQRKMKERRERKLAGDFARHLEEEREKRRQEKKQRRAENLRRRLENERKAEVVQVIRNPAKLKRAKKKQLRSIQKRDTLALLQKLPPPRRPGDQT